MPMLDAHIPAGALAPEAERDLIAKLTDLLIEHEGADPRNEVVRSIAWVFVSRPESVYVAGAPADAPRYRFVASVPEGQFNPERRQALVEAITEAVLDAEQGAHPRDPMRVWVFTPEVPDGTWGGAGRVVRLADIAGLALGDADAGREYAERVFAERRGEAAPVGSST
jgi:phenylpyruvate tautomerase PptA (4-oxalocrotonate tautomerase family)